MSRILWALVVVLCAGPPVTAQAIGDDFDDDTVDAAKWGTDYVTGHGVLKEVNHHLEYTVGSPTSEDAADRPWLAGVGPYDADWEVQIDLFNATTPDQSNQVDSFGIYVFGVTEASGNEFYAELYASSLGAPSSLRRGFYAELLAGGTHVGGGDNPLDGMSGAVRIAFDAATKVVTAFYDVDPSDGYAWVPFVSFGVAGSGGANANADFGMTSSDVFLIGVYGYSEAMAVPAGQMYGDNFVTTGLLPTTPPACPSVPRTGCRRAGARTGALTIKDKAGGTKDALAWTWGKGAATTKMDFGDPFGPTSLQLCVYDGSGMRLAAVAPAGRSCGRKSCWKATKTGYQFRDKSLGADGILLLSLKGGADGKAKIVFKGKGANLGPPAPPLALPVTVQLARSDGDLCWESTFAAATKNQAGSFKARAD